jgi:hypothetical protein
MVDLPTYPALNEARLDLSPQQLGFAVSRRLTLITMYSSKYAPRAAEPSPPVQPEPVTQPEPVVAPTGDPTILASTQEPAPPVSSTVRSFKPQAYYIKTHSDTD